MKLTLKDILTSTARAMLLAPLTYTKAPNPARDRCYRCGVQIGAGRAGRQCLACRTTPTYATPAQWPHF